MNLTTLRKRTAALVLVAILSVGGAFATTAVTASDAQATTALVAVPVLA